MTSTKRVALVGDFSSTVTAHAAIPKALTIASAHAGCPVEGVWVGTTELETSIRILQGFDGIWCVPASPYASMAGALNAIRHARETGLPFLGTCGGYQHAALEFARNVLGHAQAANSEVDPDASMPLIAPLVCALVETNGQITFSQGSNLEKIHGTRMVEEAYHCSYGVAPRYLDLFDGSALRFTGFDDDGDPRAFELASHAFFIGTAYQPERTALAGRPHPLIAALAAAVAGKLSLAA